MEYFKNLFAGSSSHFPQHLEGLITTVITDEDNSRLCRMPNDIEIWDVVKALEGTKALGPDSFTTLFYQCYWPSIKWEVISNG